MTRTVPVRRSSVKNITNTTQPSMSSDDEWLPDLPDLVLSEEEPEPHTTTPAMAYRAGSVIVPVPRAVPAGGTA